MEITLNYPSKFSVQNAETFKLHIRFFFYYKGKKQLNVYNFSKEGAKRRLRQEAILQI